MHGASDEVVIVVPTSDGNVKSDSLYVGGLAEHSVCIDTEDLTCIDPNSPKTVTESSSKFFLQFS